jgi:uncharacterized metal-binding protein
MSESERYLFLLAIAILAVVVLFIFLAIAWLALPELTSAQFFLLHWRLYLVLIAGIALADRYSQRFSRASKREWIIRNATRASNGN